MRWFHEIKLQFLDSDLILKTLNRDWDHGWHGTGLSVPKIQSRGHESQSLESRECPKDICLCPNCPKNPTPITHTCLRLGLNSENLGIRIETGIQFVKFLDWMGRGFIFSLRSGLGNFLPTPGLPSGDSLYSQSILQIIYYQDKSECQIYMYLTEVFQKCCTIVDIVIQRVSFFRISIRKNVLKNRVK